MQSLDELDERLKQSTRLLHAWGWMSELSTEPEEALEVLNAEARFLVGIGTKYPKRWREIGSLICAYSKLIAKLKSQNQCLADVAHG